MNFTFFTTKSADVSAYDYGYMSTNGKDGLAATETTNKENPYYFKLEQPGQIELQHTRRSCNGIVEVLAAAQQHVKADTIYVMFNDFTV